MRNGLCGAVRAPPRRTRQRTFSLSTTPSLPWAEGRRESPAKQNRMEDVCFHGVRCAEEKRGTKAPCAPIVFLFIWRNLLPGPVCTVFEAVDNR